MTPSCIIPFLFLLEKYLDTLNVISGIIIKFASADITKTNLSLLFKLFLSTKQSFENT